MFTTQEVISALILGLLVGGVMGAIAWELLVAEPARRREERTRSRLALSQLAHYRVGWRHDAQAALIRNPELVADNDLWSMNDPAEHPAMVMGTPRSLA